MKISFIFCIIFFCVLYITCPVILAILFKKQKVCKITALILLFFFVMALICGVFSKFSISDNFVQIFFDFSSTWFSGKINFNIINLEKFDLFVNIIMLAPLGVVISIFFRTKIFRF